MKFISAAIALLAAFTQLLAVDIPAGGVEMSASATLSAYADGKVGKVEKLDPTGFRLSITQPDPTNSFRAQVSIACPQGALAQCDKVLALVTARVSGQETASIEAKLQLAEPPYSQATSLTGIPLSPEWTDYPLLFVVENPIPEGKAIINLFCANAEQVIEVAAIRVFRYAPDTDVSDHFTQLAPAQSITEFDIKTTADEELAADYTRDLLIACFSHPAYTSFQWWGFWEGSHWIPSAASWKKDWTILQRGKVMEEWLGKSWRTETTLTTDATGRVQWRGFPGHYDITLPSKPQAIAKFSVSMRKPASAVTLSLP